MTCSAIMTASPMTLRGDDTVAQAAEVLMSKRFIILPVVDGDGRYLGLFGAFELVSMLLPRAATINRLIPDLGFMADNLPALQEKFAEFKNEPIKTHLRSNLPVLRPDTPVVEALLLFVRERSTLPVVDAASGRLLGVLSYWDALASITGSIPPQAGR
jgi:CBS-domain-containing membrane protein